MITPLMTALLLLASEGRPAEMAHLRLELRVPETTLLVGQPTKVLVVVSADIDTQFDPNFVGLLISNGTGFRSYQTPAASGPPAWLFPPTVGPTKTFDVERRIDLIRDGGNQAEDATHRFAFGTPGKYLVKARYGFGFYRPEPESNVVEIVVKAPNGRDRELFETHLRSHPELVYQGGASDPTIDPEMWKRARKLCEEYGDSPYLSAVQLAVWLEDLQDVVGRAVEQGPAAGAARPAAIILLREVAGKPLSGPFDEARLLMVANGWLNLGDRAEARRTYELVRQRYPQSAAARKAEEWMRTEAEGLREQDEFLKEAQKMLREHGIDLPTPSPTPPAPNQ